MPPPASPTPGSLSDAEFTALAAYRHALRRFLYFSTEAARRSDLTQQQYQVLLAVRAASAPGSLTIGELAATMQLRHHSTVGLVDRLVRRKWLRRVKDRVDGRRVHVELTPLGDKMLHRLAAIHFRELRQLGPELVRALQSLGVG
jgi:DNA-binding MarR family transcriptional regulator